VALGARKGQTVSEQRVWEWRFYWWALKALDLDSPEVDDILEKVGLELTKETVEDCRNALRNYVSTHPVPKEPPHV